MSEFVCAAHEGRLADLERLLLRFQINARDPVSDSTALGAQLSRWTRCKTIYRAYKALASDPTSDQESFVHLLHKGRASSGSRYKPFHDQAVMTQTLKRRNGH